MKKIILLVLVVVPFTTLWAQGGSKALFKLPEANLQTMDGKPFNTKNLQNR
jgi:hypothetical protein